MNDTGKGGFGDNPDHINRNGRPLKEESLTHALGEEFTPEELAVKLRWFIFQKNDFNALKYVYDRREGKPRETVHTMIENLPDVIEVDLSETNTDTGDAPAVEEPEPVQDS